MKTDTHLFCNLHMHTVAYELAHAGRREGGRYGETETEKQRENVCVHISCTHIITPFLPHFHHINTKQFLKKKQFFPQVQEKNAG